MLDRLLRSKPSGMTRRELIVAALTAGTLRAAPKPKTPLVCVSSQALTGVGYAEIGEIVKQLGRARARELAWRGS